MVEKTVMIARPRDAVFAWTLEGRNFQKIFPDPIRPLRGWSGDTVKPDEVYGFRQWMFGFVPLRWIVHIVGWDPPNSYSDRQLEGPLRYFAHRHICQESGPGATLYTDRVEFRSIGFLWFDRRVLRRHIERIFSHRQRRMKELLEDPPAEDEATP